MEILPSYLIPGDHMRLLAHAHDQYWKTYARDANYSFM